MGLNLLLSLLIQFAYQVTANCSMSVRKILLTSVKKKNWYADTSVTSLF